MDTSSDFDSAVRRASGASDNSVSIKINGATLPANGDCDSLSDSLNGTVTSAEGSSGVAEPCSPVTDPDELALLEKLQQANQMLEADSRSLHSLTSQRSRRISPCSSELAVGAAVTNGTGGPLSRRDSMSSILSGTSMNSAGGGGSVQCDDASQENLWNLWGGVINEWENSSRKKSTQIKELVRRGIPQPFRGIAWQLLCGVDHDCPEKRSYSDYLKMSSPYEKTISRDITRTYPSHDLFKDKDGIGQESLFNVMKAYSLHDREVGYCQGSGFIVGLLLMQMPEEEAFAVLVKMMHAYNLRELFKPSMAELGLRMFQLETLIHELLPELYNHFQAHGIATSMFASSWFLALYTTVLPLPLACHVFDVFLSEGVEVIFRVGIAILQLNLEDLLALDMEETIKYLQKDLAIKLESDPELLMATAFQVKYNARRLKKVEKEYNAMKTKELEEQVELRRLRTENKLLQQRIDNLEKETETLADRLIQDQVKCAQQEEQICILRQKVASKQDDADLSSPESVSATSSPSDGIGSSLVARMSRPLSLLPAPWFNSKDKVARRAEQLQKEVDDAGEALLRTRCRLQQLENENEELRKQQERASSPEDMQALHEELIVCKLREAESNMAMKQLQNEIFEIRRQWQRCQDRTLDAEKLAENDALMIARLKIAELTSQLAERQQRLLITEQQSSVIERHSERLTQENASLKEQLATNNVETSETAQQLEATILDLKSKQKEDAMLAKLRDSEHLQLVTEMRRRIAELELQNEDLIRAAQRQLKCNCHGSQPGLQSGPENQDGSLSDDQNKVADPAPVISPTSASSRSFLRPSSLIPSHVSSPSGGLRGISPLSAPPRRCRSNATQNATHTAVDLTPTNENPSDQQRTFGSSSSPRRHSVERSLPAPRMECAGAT